MIEFNDYRLRYDILLEIIKTSTIQWKCDGDDVTKSINLIGCLNGLNHKKNTDRGFCAHAIRKSTQL